MGLRKTGKRRGRTASVTHRAALIGHMVKNAVERNHRIAAEAALARARAKYPNFEEWRPTMAAIAMQDGMDWSRGMDEIYADLYFQATMGDGRWGERRTKCWQPR